MLPLKNALLLEGAPLYDSLGMDFFKALEHSAFI